MFRILFFLASHTAMLAIGFALGVYFLPILTAPDGPSAEALEESTRDAVYTAELTRDLPGSDSLHWGEGKISLSPTQIAHEGRLSPGPDYMAYLVPSFADDEASFLALKGESLRIGSIKSFDGFLLDVPEGTNLEDYTTILVWCEAFSEFITAAKYR